MIADCLKSDSPDDYRIQVSQWEPFIVDREPKEQVEKPSEENSQEAARRRFYTFSSFYDTDNSSKNDLFDIVPSAPSNDSSLVQENTKPKLLSIKPSIIGQSVSVVESTSTGDVPLLNSFDLWEKDNTCHQATREGFTLSPDVHGYGGRNVTIGLGEAASTATLDVTRAVHRRAVSYDPDLVSRRLQEDVESIVIKDRLHGYVRHYHAHSNAHPSQEFTGRHHHDNMPSANEFP